MPRKPQYPRPVSNTPFHEIKDGFFVDHGNVPPPALSPEYEQPLEQANASDFAAQLDAVIGRNGLRLTADGEGITNDNDFWEVDEKDWAFIDVHRKEILDRLRLFGPSQPIAREVNELVSLVTQPTNAAKASEEREIRSKFTYWDARKHWREGTGGPVYVDARSLSLPEVTALDFSEGVGDTTQVPALGADYAVHGTVTLVLNPDYTVSIIDNEYNFDQKNYDDWHFNTAYVDTKENMKRFLRNQLTRASETHHGQGRPFTIKFVGKIPLSKL